MLEFIMFVFTASNAFYREWNSRLFYLFSLWKQGNRKNRNTQHSIIYYIAILITFRIFQLKFCIKIFVASIFFIITFVLKFICFFAFSEWKAFTYSLIRMYVVFFFFVVFGSRFFNYEFTCIPYF